MDGGDREVQAAIAMLQRFRLNADRVLNQLRKIGADPKLIEAAAASYQEAQKVHEQLMMDLTERPPNRMRN